MRIILVGAGGVGDAFARIAVRRAFFESCVVADYDPARAERTVAAVDDPRFVAAVRELVLERAAAVRGEEPVRRSLGELGASHDVCPAGCCPNAGDPQRPALCGVA